MGIADLNADGRLDIVINNNHAAPTIFLNRHRATGHWLNIGLTGDPAGGSNRDAIGARVRLYLPGGKMMTRLVEAGSGYAAQSAFPVHFGLGEAEHIEALEIDWPSGLKERFEGEDLSALGIEPNRAVQIAEKRNS